MAVASPLMETSINGAHGVLINITGSEDMGLEDVEAAANLVQEAAHPDANIIFGATFDDSMQDEIRVTVIATGFEENANAPAVAAPAPGVVARPAAPVEKTSGLFSGAVEKAASIPTPVMAPVSVPTPAPAPAPAAAPAGEEEDPFDKIFSIFNHK